jgi:hypothetical protein
MRVFLLLIVTALAACGVDGAPERPGPGISVGGEAQVGVVLR